MSKLAALAAMLRGGDSCYAVAKWEVAGQWTVIVHEEIPVSETRVTVVDITTTDSSLDAAVDAAAARLREARGEP